MANLFGDPYIGQVQWRTCYTCLGEKVVRGHEAGAATSTDPAPGTTVVCPTCEGRGEIATPLPSMGA